MAGIVRENPCTRPTVDGLAGITVTIAHFGLSASCGATDFFRSPSFLDARMNFPDFPLVQAQAQALAAE
jgi:hypothetical protein